jgi:phosphoenolpyruvate-protein phosphotransferase/dihydroxyacetone kinase phosphotransfer subunit
VVGIVVVSHSEQLADGVVALAREMAGEELALESAGGIEEPGVLGTDAERVRAAIERAMSADGVLVLMDLGSALMSAEFALELVESPAGPVRLSEAPLVEGTVAAAVAASGGATLDEVAEEARAALTMKAAQLDEAVTDDELDGTATAAPEREIEHQPEPDARAELTVANEIGLHARPAARIISAARRFQADVRVATEAGDGPVRATSLTALLGLGARQGDTLFVTASGPEAREALDALRELADDGFGDGLVAEPVSDPAIAPITDEPGGTGETGETDPQVPDSPLHGVGASPGIAIGPARRLRGPERPPPERAAQDPAAESALLERGRAGARAEIGRDRARVAQRAGEAEAEIFDAHLALLDDEALLEPAEAAIQAGSSAGRAWYDAARRVAERYRALPERLLQERAVDVLDVGRRVVAELTSTAAEKSSTQEIVIADELTPADAARLDPALALGIATARGSTTSHAAILARALGLPAVVGLGDGVLGIAAGTTLLLDADAGSLTIDPPEQELAQARVRAQRAARRRAEAGRSAHEPAVTRDGQRIAVFANLGGVGEAAPAVELGAEGVGLLRTEFLFLNRSQLPAEQEQTEILGQIAAALDGRPLIVRTLDAGADKPMAALPMPREDNPFLGVRGIRLALRRPEVLATQLRAILRVAEEYPVKAMLPMVTTLDEVLEVRRVLEQARGQTGVEAELELGIMIEVPAAALAAARLAAHVDFFSIGTNDLAQYTMAAERGDARLASLLAGPQPAVLRLIGLAVEGARAHGRPVGVCGELAGDPAAAVLLAGLGVTELSMTPVLVPEVKAALRGINLQEARVAALAAIETDSAPAARELALALL